MPRIKIKPRDLLELIKVGIQNKRYETAIALIDDCLEQMDEEEKDEKTTHEPDSK